MAIEDFAQYKIIKKLGKGGMGEVFLAEDTKLSRRIALKFLSSEAILSKEQIHRFEQEARAISSLNHPNILTIYEIGQADNREYIATEFVDGKTLREYLANEPTDPKKILDAAVQICAALEAAHHQGIVHRDIKPENIMVRRDGLVKVLDFGLAKLVQKSPELMAAVDAEAPTRANLSTAPGLIMGTSFYLSPEQARGKSVDARTDIWSFGVVLYEAITKNHPFKGETTSDVIASILKTEPPLLNVYVSNIPPELQRIIEKTLRKDCEERYQSAKDLLVDLKSLNHELNLPQRNSDASLVNVTEPNEAHPQTDPQIGGVTTKPQTFTPSPDTKPKRVWAGATLAALVIFAGFSGWHFWKNAPEKAANLTAPLAVTQLISWKNDLGEESLNRARFSPDGKFIAFSSTKNGKSDIWLKQVGVGEAIQVTKDAQNSLSPVWSADGGEIALLSERGGQKGIWKMPTLGGAMTLLTPLETLSYNLVHWSKDGKTIYYERNGSLYALDLASRQAAPLINLNEGEHQGEFRVSADEESFSYVKGGGNIREVWTIKKGGEPKRLTSDSTEDSNPIWLPDGKRLVYNLTRNSTTQIGLAFTDDRAPVQLSVSNSDGKVLDVSPDGSKILFASERNEADLWGIKLDTGKEFQITSDLGLEVWTNVAPDNNSITFQMTDLPTANNLRNSSIMKKPVTSDGQPVTLAENGFAPHWSPDGTQLAYLREIDGIKNLWLVGSGGGDAHQLTNSNVTFGGNTLMPPYNLLETQDYQWTPDGKALIFCAVKDKIANIWQINADGTNETMLSANSEPNLIFMNPTFSPDGKDLAWLSLAPKQNFLRTLWVSRDGKSKAVYQSNSLFHIVGWSPNGNELIIRILPDTVVEPQTAKDVDLMSVSLDGVTRSIARLPQIHFNSLQLSPDGKQIALVSHTDSASSLQIISANGGATKTVLTENDARSFFSNPVWSPDNKTIYFSKQRSWSVISMIENFK